MFGIFFYLTVINCRENSVCYGKKIEWTGAEKWTTEATSKRIGKLTRRDVSKSSCKTSCSKLRLPSLREHQKASNTPGFKERMWEVGELETTEILERNISFFWERVQKWRQEEQGYGGEKEKKKRKNEMIKKKNLGTRSDTRHKMRLVPVWK